MTDLRLNSPNRVSRRDFLKVAALSSLALGVGAASYRRFLLEDEFIPVRGTRFLMGTIVHFTVIAKGEAEGSHALKTAFDEMQRLVDIFDFRKDTSPLAQLNKVGVYEHAPRELIEVITSALRYSQLTQGAFDVTVKPIIDAYQKGLSPTPLERKLVDYRHVIVQDRRVWFNKPGIQITLDSLAKGHVIDETAKSISQMGFENILVEAGGDLIALGSSGNENPWQIGILHPRFQQSGVTLTEVPVISRAIATSGDYMNSFSSDYSLNHIIDPATASSPPDLASVSVIAPTAMDADALSTAIMVMGSEKGLALANQLPNVEALLVDKKLNIYRTSGFPVELIQ